MQTLSPTRHRRAIPSWLRRICGYLWKIFVFLGTVVVLGLGVNVLSTWLTSSKGLFPADSPLAHLLAQWPLPSGISGCLLLMAFLTRILSQEPLSSPAPSATTLLMSQNRRQMLRRLRYSYHELNTQSLQGTTKLDLRLVNKPDAVQNTTNLVLRQAHQPEHMLPAGTTIAEVYEQAAHELLILGEPGAGKSTLLYQLGLHLVEQAERDETFPLPIILPLSSWAVKRRPLQEWMEEQLSSPLYGIPHQIGQQWIQSEQILPLLDGLDEMEASAQASCIDAINYYRHNHLHPLIVCSRSTEYMTAAIRKRLTLQNSVIIQPLTNQQVDNMLIQGGEPLTTLRSELRENPGLRSLARNPLILSILQLVYQSTTLKNLSRMRPILQQQIFTAYIQRMLGKEDNKRYPQEKTIAWLCWLAQQMRAHNQTIFYLEQLQPDWLSHRSRLFYRWSILLVFTLGIVLFEELVWTLLMTLLFLFLERRVNIPLEGLPGALFMELSAGLCLGLFFRRHAIRPAELLTWSWKDIWLRIQVGIALGLTGGVAFLSLPALAAKIAGKQLRERLHLTPGEGIRLSAKNGISVGLTVGFMIGFILGPIEGLLFGNLLATPMTLSMKFAFELFEGLFLGLFIGLLIGLIFGLGAYLQHYVLRFWLWRTLAFPWKAIHFLDKATTYTLLRRVGGGYSFSHRLLLDYFADLDEQGSPSVTPRQKSGAAKTRKRHRAHRRK
jgi:hypothetical protein